MRRILIAGFLALGLISAAAPAARALDPDALRQDIIAALNRGLSAYRNEPFLFTGVETVAQGAAVRVKIADLALPLPDLGGRIEFGDLAFTLADAPPGPAAGDHRYLVSEVITASQATIVDDVDDKIVLINYGLERLAGVWSTALRSFLDFDLAVDRFEVVVPEENLGFAIDRFTAVNQVVTRGDGLTDWEGEGRIAGLRMIKPAVGTLRIGEILVEARAHGFDLAGMQAMNEALDEVANRTAPPDRNRIAAILERLQLFSIMGQGFIERFKVTDLSYLDADQRPRFHLDDLEFDLAGGDLHLALGYGSMGLRMTGARTILPGSDGGGAGNPLQSLAPESLSLIASIERLPIRAMWRSLLKLLLLGAAAGEQGPDPDAINNALGAEFQAAVNEAGTVLRLDHLDIETPSGRLRAEGSFQVDPATAVGVRGRMDLTINGLDEMIAIATNAAQSGQAAPGVQGNMMILMMLKGMAKREFGPDGGTVDRLQIVVTPAGDVLLNGLPFSMAPPQ
ncbi:MAG: DUF2125 domain-containing protein [Alphaproteobacteria bacterium]